MSQNAFVECTKTSAPLKAHHQSQWARVAQRSHPNLTREKNIDRRQRETYNADTILVAKAICGLANNETQPMKRNHIQTMVDQHVANSLNM